MQAHSDVSASTSSVESSSFASELSCLQRLCTVSVPCLRAAIEHNYFATIMHVFERRIGALLLPEIGNHDFSSPANWSMAR
jgi:hypothetical protein